MRSYFHIFEELLFFDLWILDSGFQISDSGFCVLGLPKISHDMEKGADSAYPMAYQWSDC